jgi:alkylation response protein AidB-like acyl-CoA dehydrogenase
MLAEDLRTQDRVVAEVRRFVEAEVMPVADRLEHADEYPFALVEQMKALGLFGATVDERYGGLGLPVSTYARIIEEICRGWMSLSGIINSHLLAAYIVERYGDEEQKRRLLPPMAAGERRGGICLTEPGAGSDLQAIETTAVRRGDEYVVNGTKLFVTNGRHGKQFAVLVKTDRSARPAYRGMSVLMIEKEHPGFSVARDIKKLGYKGVETCELVFQDCRVPAANLIGPEGEGFKEVLSALELGRINVAARGVGVAQAAFERAISYAQRRESFGKPIAEHQAIQLKLAEMATSIQAARLLTRAAAEKKDRGERADLEAGMAKLFASEAAFQVATEAIRIHGGYGYTQDLSVERYYRDAPLMIVGEGTNEIQKLVIAKQLLAMYPAR